METTKLSGKYQIVVPKAIREQLKLKAGMFVALHPIDDDRAILVKHPADYVKALKGLGKDLWKELGGGAQYLRKERASWQKS